LAIASGKGVGICYSERQRDLTTFAVDAGASPEWACVFAAIHSLGDRASATEPGVRVELDLQNKYHVTYSRHFVDLTLEVTLLSTSGKTFMETDKKRMNHKQLWGISVGLILLLVGLVSTSHAKDVTPKSKQVNRQIPTTISISYVGDWNSEARTAMEYAATIWANAIYSPVPINIEARWDHDFLGGPAYVSQIWVQGFRGAPNPTAYYPLPLANALSPAKAVSSADFSISFNSDFSNWYFGIDGATPPGDYDFVTVALKYIGWGFGFNSWMSLCGPMGGCWGSNENRVYPLIYDTFVVNGNGQHLTDTSLFPNPSLALQNELMSDNIYFAGPAAIAANGGTMPKLYAPTDWQAIKYPLFLDDGAFPAGSVNALMTHTLNTGEAIHHPGPLALAMLHDLGWPNAPQSPHLAALPSQLLLVNTSRDHAIDLLVFASDPDTPNHLLTFSIINNVPTELGVSLQDGRYININPQMDWTGSGEVTIEVRDPTNLTDSQTFNVLVVEQVFSVFLPVIHKGGATN
jgi:hypothetical protein